MGDPTNDENLTIWTIGHSNQSFEQFLDLLKRHQIDDVVDVRSSPYSRYATHFSKEAIEDSLARHRIRYIFLGDLIGGRRRPSSTIPKATSSTAIWPSRQSFKKGWIACWRKSRCIGWRYCVARRIPPSAIDGCSSAACSAKRGWPSDTFGATVALRLRPRSPRRKSFAPPKVN